MHASRYEHTAQDCKIPSTAAQQKHLRPDLPIFCCLAKQALLCILSTGCSLASVQVPHPQRLLLGNYHPMRPHLRRSFGTCLHWKSDSFLSWSLSLHSTASCSRSAAAFICAAALRSRSSSPAKDCQRSLSAFHLYAFSLCKHVTKNLLTDHLIHHCQLQDDQSRN